MSLHLKERLELFVKVLSESSVFIGGTSYSMEYGLNKAFNTLLGLRELNRDLYIIGNGGSTAVASHAVVDFLNVGNLSAHTLHEAAVLTCMSNDYGYKHAYSNIIRRIIKKQDVLIAISSSGQSENILNGVTEARNQGAFVITLTGFNCLNNLKNMGDINFWVDSYDYGMVEIAHQFILHNLADRFKDKDNQ
ncbi:MAG TPA: SIS domain-containing protein [Aeromonadales bacterium]|nr:SIS domain-containing protein [Aeromonadales bacterium]